MENFNITEISNLFHNFKKNSDDQDIMSPAFEYFAKNNAKIIYFNFTYNNEEFNFMSGFPVWFTYKGIEYYLRFEQFNFGETENEFELVFGSWEKKDVNVITIPSSEIEQFVPIKKSEPKVNIPSASLYQLCIDQLKTFKIPQKDEDFVEPYEYGYSLGDSVFRLSNHIENLGGLDDIYQVYSIDKYKIILEKHTKIPIGYFESYDDISSIVFRNELFRSKFYGHLASTNKIESDIMIPVLQLDSNDLALAVEYEEDHKDKTGFIYVNNKFIEVKFLNFTKNGLSVFMDNKNNHYYMPINQLYSKV